MNLVRCLSFPVICVLVLVAFVYYTVVMLVIEPWLSLSTGTGLFNGLAFTLMTIMALICYGLAILRDPGRVPTSYIPDLEDSQNCLQEIKRKGGDLRYCQKCKHYKPPRAHHCRVCKRCVLRMDHHCVWINNCVGHSNYKAFFLFVFYIVGASIHALTLLGFHAVEEFGRLQQGSEDKFMRVQPASTIDAVSSLLKILCGTILLPLFVALSVLLTWHVYLLFQNKTTIEYHEGIRARWLAESAGQLFQHPYDLGPFSNLIMVLGPDAICWFCPSAVSHIGTGLQFPTFSDHGYHKQFG